MGFLKTPEIPLEGNFFRFPREAEKSRTKAVRFLKSTEIPLEGLIFHPLHVADWPRVYTNTTRATTGKYVPYYSNTIGQFSNITSSVSITCRLFLH